MESYEFDFKKGFGQNFLRDPNIVKKIVDSAHIKEHSLVIEIGPGAGILTQELSKAAEKVVAYEIDDRLETILDHNLANCSNIDVIYADFLKRNLKEDLKNYKYDHLYVVSNLPYYITTPIIMKLIDEAIEVERIVIMVQKEVGYRFGAVPGKKEYNSLTVFLNYYFDIEKLFIVNRNQFIPKPNVDSIVIALTKKETLLMVKDRNLFFQLVRDSFQYKRKTIRNNLKHYDLSKIEQVLTNHHYDLAVRAEQLPLEVFVDISNHLA